MPMETSVALRAEAAVRAFGFERESKVTPTRPLVVPAYCYVDEGIPRIAFRCFFCRALHRHGDTGAVLEKRGNDGCMPHCPLGSGYTMLIVGAVPSLDALPNFPPMRATALIELLTNRLGAKA